jgi:hypothetical protein
VREKEEKKNAKPGDAMGFLLADTIVVEEESLRLGIIAR